MNAPELGRRPNQRSRLAADHLKVLIGPMLGCPFELKLEHLALTKRGVSLRDQRDGFLAERRRDLRRLGQ